MACNLINVGFGGDACKENFSGVGGTAYFFLKRDVTKAPAYDETKNAFAVDAFTDVPVYKVKLKKKVNKVDWTNNPNGGGYTNTATLVVADDMDNMAFNGRNLNNLGGDFGVMIPKSTSDGTSEYYVIYNHDFGTDFTLEGTTGDAPDSDHGHTITVAATMFYGPVTWAGNFKEVSAPTTEKPETGEDTGL